MFVYRMKNLFDIPTLCIFIRHNGSSRTYNSAVKCRKLLSASKTSDITAREDRSPLELEKRNIEVFQPRRFIYTVSITLLLFKKRSNTKNCGSIPFMLDEYLRSAV